MHKRSFILTTLIQLRYTTPSTKSNPSKNCHKREGPCQSLKRFKVRRLWEQISISTFLCGSTHLSSPSPVVVCLHLQSIDLYCSPLSPRDLSLYLLYLCQTVMAFIMHLPLSSLYWVVIFHAPAVYQISWLLMEIGIQLFLPK